MRLKTFSDDDGIFQAISKKLNNGDWDYYLVFELIDWQEYNPNESVSQRYHFSLSAVSFDALTEKSRKSVLEQLQDLENPSDVCEAIETYNYGYGACLWQADGSIKSRLQKEMRKQLSTIPFLFGFYMDKRQNAVGATGWDFIQGSLSPL